MKMFRKIINIIIIILLSFTLQAVPFIDNITDNSITVPARAEVLTSAAIAALVWGIVTVAGVNLGLNYNVNNQSLSYSMAMDIYNDNAAVKGCVDTLLSSSVIGSGIKQYKVSHNVINAVRDYLINKFNLHPGDAGYNLSHSAALGYAPEVIFIDGFNLPLYKYDTLGDLNNEDSPFHYLAAAGFITYKGYTFYENITSGDTIVNNIMYKTPNGNTSRLESLFSRPSTSSGHFYSDFCYVYCGDSIAAVRRTNGSWSKDKTQIAFSYAGYNFLTGESNNFTVENSPVWTPCDELAAADYVNTLPITVDDDVLFTDDTEDVTIALKDSYIGLTRDDVIVKPGDITIPGDIAVPGDIAGDITIPGDITVPDEGASMKNKLNLDPLKVSGELLSTRFPFCLPFDLYNAFSEFKNTSGKVLYFELPIDMKYLGKHKIILDFKDYTSLANIVKYFIYISFCVGLIIITRKLIGGE